MTNVKQKSNESDIAKKHEPKKEREVGIDLLECVAILLVIMCHSPIYSCYIIGDASPINYLRFFLKTLIAPCVALFFFANGYLLFNREFNLKKHIYKILKLVTLCFVWGLIKILILMPIRNEYLTPIEILRGLWDWKLGWIESLWFIGTLVCIYLFFPLLKTAYDNKKNVFYYFLIMCTIFTIGNSFLNESASIALTTFFNKTTPLEGFNFFNFFNPFRNLYGYAFAYFCIGGLVYNFKDKILAVKPLKRNIIAVITMIVSCLCLWGIGIYYTKTLNRMWDLIWNGYDTVFTLINVICIYVLCLNLKKDVGLIRLISCNTLGIYFVHEIFINLTKGYIEQYPFLCNFSFNIVYAIIILILSLLIVILMKKIPIINRLVK